MSITTFSSPGAEKVSSPGNLSWEIKYKILGLYFRDPVFSKIRSSSPAA